MELSVPDLTGLPSLQLATVHADKDTVEKILKLYPELALIPDNVSVRDFTLDVMMLMDNCVHILSGSTIASFLLDKLKML